MGGGGYSLPSSLAMLLIVAEKTSVILNIITGIVGMPGKMRAALNQFFTRRMKMRRRSSHKNLVILAKNNDCLVLRLCDLLTF